jgi:hypothetical protein
MAAKKFKVGSKVRIIDNISNHGFDKGDIVSITKIFEDSTGGDHYRADSKEDFWYVVDEELEEVK